MDVILKSFSLNTKPGDIINITSNVESCLLETGLKDGIVCVFIAGSTAGHLRSFLLKPELTVPFSKKLILGTWQQIIMLELDEKKRTRKIYCQFIGKWIVIRNKFSLNKIYYYRLDFYF